MKITLLNGNVVEGSLEELTVAGLIPSRTMASLAVSQQMNLFTASLTAQPAVKAAPTVTVAVLAIGRPKGALRLKIEEAIDKAIESKAEQRVPIASMDESKARTIVFNVAKERNVKVSANKVRVGDRIALILSV